MKIISSISIFPNNSKKYFDKVNIHAQNLKDKIISNDSLYRKVIRNSAIILSGNVATSALGFVSFAIMANSLGPELLAMFALAQLYAGIANNLLNVQTWESMIKFGAKDDQKDLIENTIKTNFIIDIISAFIAFLFALLALRTTASLLDWDQELVDLAFVYSLTIPFTITTFTIGIPRLFNQFFIVAKIQLTLAVLKLSLIAAISFHGGGVVEFTGVYILTEILLNLLLIALSLKLTHKNNLNWLRAKVRLDREQLKFLWWTNLRTIVRIPVRQLDILIINQVMNLETVGIYKVYKEVVGVIGRLGEPINQAIYPEYAKLLGKDNTTDTIAVTKKIMAVLLSASIITMTVFLIASELLIQTMFGADYLTLMTAFYLLVVLNCINLFLTPINSLFVAAGFARYGFYIVLFNNIIYLIAALFGGIYFGIYGIVLAFALQMVFNQGLKIIFLRKYSSGWGSVIR